MGQRLADSGAAQVLRGAAALGVTLADRQVEQLLDYCALLEKWNQAHNLVSRQDLHRLYDRHLLDCLSLVPWLAGGQVLDIGSGGGLPGMVLAIASPERRFTLLDSNGRKTRFLTQVRAELDLQHVDVVQCRAEAFTPAAPFDTITARAVAERRLLVAWAGQHAAADGQFLRMAGPGDLAGADQPVADATGAAWAVHAQHAVAVPGVAQTLYIEQLRRSS